MDARITFRIPSSLRSALKGEAKRDKRTLSNLVILLLEKALKDRKEQVIPQYTDIRGTEALAPKSKESVNA